MSPKLRWFLGSALGGLALDQATKLWVATHIRYDGPLELPFEPVAGPSKIDVIPHFFALVHAQNPGSAFGSFTTWEHRYTLFYVFAAVATVIVLDLLRRLPRTETVVALSLGLILAGAHGNLIDRVHKGSVTDFLRFYTDDPALVRWLHDTVGAAEWPSFNVADASLFVGVALFLLHYVLLEDEEPEAPAP
jgi:signal peptidase II